jgi:hypothetical protein
LEIIVLKVVSDAGINNNPMLIQRFPEMMTINIDQTMTFILKEGGLL